MSFPKIKNDTKRKDLLPKAFVSFSIKLYFGMQDWLFSRANPSSPSPKTQSMKLGTLYTNVKIMQEVVDNFYLGKTVGNFIPLIRTIPTDAACLVLSIKLFPRSL